MVDGLVGVVEFLIGIINISFIYLLNIAGYCNVCCCISKFFFLDVLFEQCVSS